MDGIPDVMNQLHCEEAFSLEKLCLDLIVQEFERFYFAFTVSKDKNLQRNFEFLQRRYSGQLTKLIHKDEYISEKYFAFLINEHLDFLDCKWLENIRYLNPMEEIFRRVPNLRRISLKTSDDEILEILDDEILENIVKFCPKIVEIDARDSYVTDAGVKYLCEIKNGTVPCPELRNIFVKNTCVTDRGAECLIRNLPSLEKLDYRNVPLSLHSIHKENVSKFQTGHSYNLVELDLLECLQFEDVLEKDYTDILKTCLTICPKLESIACFITDKEQLNFFTNKYWKKLNLSLINVDPKINIDSFIVKNGYNLTSLIVKSCTISITVVSEHCPVLEQLYLNEVSFICEDGDVQVSFPCLNECSFSKIRISDSKAVCLLLSSSPKLESISFSSAMLTLQMKNELLAWCENPSAQEIQFFHLQLEMKFVRDILLSCPSLKKMVLTNCFFDDDETKRILYILAKSLPNEPVIIFVSPSRFLPIMLMAGSLFTYSDDLEEHPDEKYTSSSNYDSLYTEIALEWDDYYSDYYF